MGSLLLKLKTWWETADRTQRTVTAFGSALLLVLVVGAGYFASRPRMQLLFGGLSPADQGMVVNELSSLGFAVQHDSNGNISVPSSRVAEARAQLAVNKKLPATGTTGAESLGSINLSTTPRVEAERIKASVEADLSRSLEQIDGVANARVHLNLGESSPFARDNRPPSASIVINESPASPLGPDGARAAQRLVQYAVTGLDAEHITVINSRGQVLVDGADDVGAAGIASDRVAAQNAEARRREQDLQRKLDAAFGLGSTVVSVPVLEMNWDQQNEKRTERLPTRDPVMVEQNKERMVSAAAGGAGGAAGTASNLAPAAPGSSSADERSFNSEQKSQSFTMSEIQTVTEKATGNITRLSVNVLANSARLDSPEKVEAVRTFVQGTIAPLAVTADGTPNPAFATVVTAIEFDTAADTAAAAASAQAATGARIQQALSLLPILALIVVGVMVVKALGKAATPTESLTVALPGGGTMSLPVSNGAVQVNGADYHGAMQALGQNPALAATHEGGEVHAPGNEGPQSAFIAVRGNKQPELIDVIPDKVNVPLEQLKLMANERPEVVAMLLKTWMMEDRR